MVMSAEAVMLGTVGVLAMTTGVSVVSNAMNEELADVSKALRGFDQTYEVNGVRASYSGVGRTSGTGGRFTTFKSGSGFKQLPSQDAINAMNIESFPAQAARDPRVIQQEAVFEETSAQPRLVSEASLQKSKEDSDEPTLAEQRKQKRQARRERRAARPSE